MAVAPIPIVFAVEWLLISSILILVIARLYLRLRIQGKTLILSDYFICIAWISAFIQAVLDIELVKAGWLNTSDRWSGEKNSGSQIALKLVYLGWVPFLTTPYLSKAAILSFYFAVFPSTIQPFRSFLWSVTIYCAISYFASLFILFFICLPIQETWFSQSSNCSAAKQNVMWIVTWALHFSSDIFIFILPFPLLHTLRLGQKQKAGLYMTFMFGIFSIGFCLVRFLTVRLSYPGVPTTNLQLWCALDTFSGLVAACLPSLRPYLHLKRKVNRTSRGFQSQYSIIRPSWRCIRVCEPLTECQISQHESSQDALTWSAVGSRRQNSVPVAHPERSITRDRV